MSRYSTQSSYLDDLQQRLRSEGPVLADVVEKFRELDRVGRAMHYLGPADSLAARISWWPLVSILGTYSAGKSSFINDYLSSNLQRTGTQAVDDKFTVICHSESGDARVLPGAALDADPRLPFYRISESIEATAKGEGERIDSYLQLKTCPNPKLRGKILIDSPGFDADAQRSSVLRIVDHIVDLSDLVLVFFDARHPDPGSMRDTLEHLVDKAIARPDSEKFVYVLNQIDATLNEDNLEEVVAAWQRALSQRGLTAGRFYCTFIPKLATSNASEQARKRVEDRSKVDRAEIEARIERVQVSRGYRIVGLLDHAARHLAEKVAPRLQNAIADWRQRVLWGDAIALGVAVVGFVAVTAALGYWDGLRFAPGWWDDFASRTWLVVVALAAILAALAFVHFTIRATVARGNARKLEDELVDGVRLGNLAGAFRASTHASRPLFVERPKGWTRRNEQRVADVAMSSPTFVKALNDHYAPQEASMVSSARTDAATPDPVD